MVIIINKLGAPPPPPLLCYQICSSATANAVSDPSPDEKRRNVGVRPANPTPQLSLCHGNDHKKTKNKKQNKNKKLTTLGKGSDANQATRLTAQCLQSNNGFLDTKTRQSRQASTRQLGTSSRKDEQPVLVMSFIESLKLDGQEP